MSIRNYGFADKFISNEVISSNLSQKVLTFNIASNNFDVDPTFIEDIWEVVQTRYLYPTVGNRLSIQSTTVNDEPLGSGLGGVDIFGLDDNYDILLESIDLNGVSTVLTDGVFLRVNRMFGYKNNAASKDTVADGIITAKDASNTLCQISGGKTASRQSMFTIPKGYSGFIKYPWVSGGANDDFVSSFVIAKKDGIFVGFSDFEVSNSLFAAAPSSFVSARIDEMSDIKVEAQAISQNSQVRVNYTIILIRNDYLSSMTDSI